MQLAISYILKHAFIFLNITYYHETSNSSSLVLTIYTFLFAKNASAQQSSDLSFRISCITRISTLGVGIEAAKGLTPSFGLRAGFNYFSYGYEATESDVSYDLDLELKSFGLMADWHSFQGAFRLSGGLLINGNCLTGNAKPTGQVKIGDTDYTLNSIDLEISYNKLAPYFGLGWDTTFGDADNWGFAFDLGLYSGSPKPPSLNPANTVSPADLNKKK